MAPVQKLSLVCFILAMCTIAGAAQDPRCGLPRVNKMGFRAHSTIAYTVAPSPDGTPFPANRIKCVKRAFDSWSRANRSTALGVQFVWGEGGIVVRRDKPGGLILSAKRGGGWTNGVRSDDGYLEKASIWVSSNPRLVDSCDGITKVVLHELGHLHGLEDNELYDKGSVMNRASQRNDNGNKIPMSPGACDAAQAFNASDSSVGMVAQPNE
jgi:hypothetical protein